MTHCHTFIKKLRQHGCRITPQREMIVAAIAHSEQHLTAEEIYAAIQPHSQAVNLATVYRTLDLLVDVGLVRRADLGNGRIMYTSDLHGPHLHLICRQCGAVVRADASLLAPIAAQLHTSYGFDADFQHICFRGLCAACRTEQ